MRPYVTGKVRKGLLEGNKNLVFDILFTLMIQRQSVTGWTGQVWIGKYSILASMYMLLVGGVAFDSVIGVPSFRVGSTTLVIQ